MTATPSAATAAESPSKKPRLALAIATVLGIGYAPKAPGTYGSVAGVATAFLSAIFFLHPRSFSDVFSLHPLADTILRENLKLSPQERSEKFLSFMKSVWQLREEREKLLNERL